MRMTARSSAARKLAAKNRTQTTEDLSQQALYKGEYVVAKAGKILKYSKTDVGRDIVRLAKLEEIVPNLEAYYLTNPHQLNKFYLHSFSHLVRWEDIKEFIREQRIYVKTAFDKSTLKSSESNFAGAGKPSQQKQSGSVSRTLFDA